MYKKIETTAKKIGKTIIIAISAIFIAVTANAQNEQTIAVYVTFKYTDDYKNVIGAKIVSTIMQEGNYTAVEKTEEFTTELKKEQNNQKVVNDNQIAKLGEQFDVEFVIVAEVAEIGSNVFIKARMLDVQTGLITVKTSNDKSIRATRELEDISELSEYIAKVLISSVKNKHSEPQDTTLIGVTINGVTWATKNIGAFSIEDYGNYYTWEQAKEICPKGWRLPTGEELTNLYSSSSTWINSNGKVGYKFGNSDNNVFLPAAGCYDTDGSYNSVGTSGYYWSSTDEGSSRNANYMRFEYSIRGMGYHYKALRLCVRCVAE
jgi:uncharacterized protein (TIGR02145 family)